MGIYKILCTCKVLYPFQMGRRETEPASGLTWRAVFSPSPPKRDRCRNFGHSLLHCSSYFRRRSFSNLWCSLFLTIRSSSLTAQ
ncbi:hypothetical protein BJX96DRAFT_159940 [Aspergillus floccosus]